MKNVLLIMLLFVSMAAYTQPTQIMDVRANLYVVNGAVETLYDGVMTQYFTGYNNAIDINDAWKLGGDWRTSIGIQRLEGIFVVERKDTVKTDTTYFINRNYRDNNIMIAVSVKNVYPANLTVDLYDAFLGTTFNVATNGSVSKYYYTVDLLNPLSIAQNRFKLVLNNPAAFINNQPVYAEFKAYPIPVRAGGSITIERPDNTDHQVYLVSMTGVKYYLGVINDITTVRIPNVPAGTYMLCDSKNKVHKRIVIL